MKSIIKANLLLLFLLLMTVSCNTNPEDNTLEAKLKDYRLATEEDLVRLGELELNSSSVPIYDMNGERYRDDQVLKILERNEYEIDYYLDKDDELGAIVLREEGLPEPDNL